MQKSSERDFEAAADRRAYEDQQLRRRLSAQGREQWDASRKRQTEQLAQTEKRQNENRRIDIDKEKAKREKADKHFTLGSRASDFERPSQIVADRYKKEREAIHRDGEKEREELLGREGISRSELAKERLDMLRAKIEKQRDNDRTRDRDR